MSDLVVNVRQVGSYPLNEDGAGGDDLVLVQQGGIGGPYYTTTPLGLLTPLEDASLGVGFAVPDNAGPGQVILDDIVLPGDGDILWNAYWTKGGQTAYLGNGVAAVLQFDQSQGFNLALAPLGFTGQLVPSWQDLFQISLAGAAQLIRGTLTVARDPAAALEVATMGWVGANTVASFNGRNGCVRLWPQDIYEALGLCSPIVTIDILNEALKRLTVVCTFNGRDGRVILTVDDVTQAFFAPLAVPLTPTPPALDRSTKIANTQWVVDFAYGKFWQDIQTGITGNYAPLNSPAFTGTPSVPPPPTNDNSSQIANTNWVRLALSSYAPLNNPSFTGIPQAPTANPGTSTSQLATTAFVMAAVQSAVTGVTSFNTRTGAITLELQDIADAGGAPIDSPAFTGIPTVPMAAAGADTNQIASTAWVLDEIAAISAGVTSFNGRSGIVLLTANDLTNVGGALLASPAFSGTPTAPTATAGTSTTQLATTAFVMTAINASVASFNGRTGAITLTSNDVSAAGGALIASPALTGTPTAPTASAGTNTTQLATTAFVATAIANVGSAYLPLTGGLLSGPGNLTVAGNVLPQTDNSSRCGYSQAWLSVRSYAFEIANANTAWIWTSSGDNALLTGWGVNVLTLNQSGGLSVQGNVVTGGTTTNALGLGVFPAADGSQFCGAIGNAWSNIVGYNMQIVQAGGSSFWTWNVSSAGLLQAVFSAAALVTIDGVGNLHTSGQVSIGGTGVFPTTTGLICGNQTSPWQIVGTNNLQLYGGGFLWNLGINGGVMAFNVAGTNIWTADGSATMYTREIAPQNDNSFPCGVSGRAWTQVVAYAFPNASSASLKRDIEPIPSTLAEITALKPATFHWRNEPASAPRHWGFLAGDVLAVMGENFAGYSKDEESGMEAIEYNNLTAVLWRGVQELIDKVNDVTAQLAALRAA
jgi:Chaperone of endosialidase